MSSQVKKWNFISSGKFRRKSILINGNEKNIKFKKIYECLEKEIIENYFPDKININNFHFI